jgi:6-phosphogluconolactonase (cycloisomerase 2 family)
MAHRFTRVLISVFVLALCLAAPGAVQAADTVAVKISPKFAYVGHYTTPNRDAETAKGIEVFSIDDKGAWKLIQTVEILNPSYLALDRKKRFLYACQGDGTQVTAFSIDEKNGMLTKLNTAESTGKNGVHLALSPDERFLALANYSGGTVDMFAVNPDGSLGKRTGSFTSQAKAGALKSQTGSWPHYVAVTDKFVVVPDKGHDVVHVLTYDNKTGELKPNDPPFMYSRPGVGSRHMSFHPSLPYAYVIEECDNAVTVCKWDAAKGVLTPVQWVPLVPDTYFYTHRGTNEEGGAAIHVSADGNFVYGTQRGLNVIATYAVDRNTGFLKPAGWESTQGARPRFFTFDPSGEVLFVANQLGDNIVAFRRDQASGKLKLAGTVANTDCPVCIVFR